MDSKQKLFLLFFFLFFSLITNGQPDTITNRIATAEDEAYWPTVNIGDYIFFRGNNSNNKAIYARSNVIKVSLDLGKKILIWRGEYERIFIDGTYCESTKEKPTVITNLGGQVKWGYSEKNDQYRALELMNFEHLLLTGKYDSIAQTGHPNYLGHNDGLNMDQGDYHQKYGLWGNPRWSGMRFYTGVSNIVRIWGFKTCKVDYVAATEGGFAGFNIKTDNPSNPKRVEIDIQNCFIGWTESEGVYISYSTSAANQDLTKLTLKNNIFVFTGTEALQTDNLTEGSVIENNVVFVASCFHRRPFQDLYQDGLHQFSFVEGGITVQDNIMLTGSYCHQIRYKDPGVGRAFPSADKKVVFKNNYYGYTRTSISYVWSGDGITKYLIDGNIYGPVYTPAYRDPYNSNTTYPAYIRICNSNTEITCQNIIYPPGRQLYKGSCGIAKVTGINNEVKIAPLLSFKNSGFSDSVDYRNFTFWSATYGTSDKKGIFIPYKKDDIIFYYDENGVTKFFKCLLEHTGDFNPLSSPDKWQLLSWDGNYKPPLDLRLKENSYYNNLKMGLNFNKEITSVFEINSNTQNRNDFFEVYPNPAKNYLIVKSKKPCTFDLQLISLDSSVILKILKESSSYEKLDIANIRSGVYILKIISKAFGVQKYKIIIA